MFQETQPEWTIQGLSNALGTSASTLYRLVRELVKAGMLESTVDARYRLGPFFIEYYRRLQFCDPFIRSGSALLKPMINQINLPCSVILARLYGEHVMCVAQANSAGMTFQTSYEIGRPMPICCGATSKTVLSTLPPKQVKRFLLRHSDVLTQERQDLELELAGIRKRGTCETSGEVDRELVGIAAPVHHAAQGIFASISVVLHRNNINAQNRPMLHTIISTTGKILENFLTTENEAHADIATR
ncbi:TPA: helix-turn-helix domain-containing protein [Klebsiella oxytoca]|nr:helix-turn-helix domain-containing protein [Klebsiella oxytoca]HCB2157716.1 helix-turn-helix domain-containing protein [Klebsiella oxytoca]